MCVCVHASVWITNFSFFFSTVFRFREIKLTVAVAIKLFMVRKQRKYVSLLNTMQKHNTTNRLLYKTSNTNCMYSVTLFLKQELTNGGRAFARVSKVQGCMASLKKKK